jgi:hypothetical protein
LLASEPARINTENSGLSAERLRRSGTAMQGYIDRQEVAGVVSLVARRGQDTHASRRHIPHCFHDQTHNQCRGFVLKDPVSQFLPEFKNRKVLIPAPSLAGNRFGLGFRVLTDLGRPLIWVPSAAMAGVAHTARTSGLIPRRR